MNSNYEFLKFIKVEGEKHLGIAVIRIDRRFIIRFKVIPSDNGDYWISSPSMKAGIYNGKDSYVSAFQFDSSYENDEIKAFILENLQRHMNPQSESVFATKAAPQQNPNNYQYSQPQQQYKQQTFNNQVQDENIPF